MRADVVEVAASIVQAPDGRVLMAQRTPGQVSPGFWELPGGKIDPGESAEQAAIRELDEEVGLRALQVRPWIRYEHPFKLRRIRLQFFKIDRWEGTPHGREGQRIAWVDPDRPSVAPVLPSVERVLDALALPPLYAVCRSIDHGGVAALLAAIALAVRHGVRAFQVREPDLAPDQRVALARRIQAIAAPAGAQVLMVGSALEARRAGVAGVHSTAEDLKRLTGRPPGRLWMCSCHDEAALARATALGADAVVLSPILRTAAHPLETPIGWEGLQRLCAAARVPVYAQGGLAVSDLDRARSAGAIGLCTAHWTDASAVVAPAARHERIR